MHPFLHNLGAGDGYSGAIEPFELLNHWASMTELPCGRLGEREEVGWKGRVIVVQSVVPHLV